MRGTISDVFWIQFMLLLFFIVGTVLVVSMIYIPSAIQPILSTVLNNQKVDLLTTSLPLDVISIYDQVVMFYYLSFIFLAIYFATLVKTDGRYFIFVIVPTAMIILFGFLLNNIYTQFTSIFPIDIKYLLPSFQIIFQTLPIVSITLIGLILFVMFL